MTCQSNKVDSNLVTLAYAREECLRQLPPGKYAKGKVLFGVEAAGSSATITVGSTTYDLVETLSAGPTVANEIVWPGDVDTAENAFITAQNLYYALVGQADQEGVGYSEGTVANSDIQNVRLSPQVNPIDDGYPGVYFWAAAAGVTELDLEADQAGIGAEWSDLGAAGDLPVWRGVRFRSFSDFGGNYTTVIDDSIDPSRQNEKGNIVDLEANGGYNVAVRKSNLTDILQGFFFAAAREMPTNRPLNGDDIEINAATVTTNTYTADAGMGIFSAGELVFVSGFSTAANNGLKLVSDVVDTYIEVEEDLVAEDATGKVIKIDTVGWQFEDDDVNFSYANGVAQLTSTNTNFNNLTKLIPGAVVFLGSDTVGNRFANNSGFARVRSKTATSLIFDECEWNPVTESGSGFGIQLYLGTIIKNEELYSLIERRSYTLERTLGPSTYNDDFYQAEYVGGCVPNELSFNIPQADRFTADLSFVGCNTDDRTGAPLDEQKDGERVEEEQESFFNTSSDVRLNRLTLGSFLPNRQSLFAFVSECTININNGVTPNKAVGVLGAFDASAGNFVVGGSIEAYFTSVEAVRAVRNNSDVGYWLVMAADNCGLVIDVPLLTLGGGRANVEKDNPIKIPLEPMGAKSQFGHTMLFEQFKYLPDTAMADA